MSKQLPAFACRIAATALPALTAACLLLASAPARASDDRETEQKDEPDDTVILSFSTRAFANAPTLVMKTRRMILLKSRTTVC